MPFGLHKQHRSKQALSALGTNPEPTSTQAQGQNQSQNQSQDQSPIFGQHHQQPHEAFARTSQRYSNIFPSDDSSADDLGLSILQEQDKDCSAQTVPVKHKKAKSIFDRMRSGRHQADQQKGPAAIPAALNYNNTTAKSSSNRLVRKRSPRLETPPTIHADERNSLEHNQEDDWPIGKGSHLESPRDVHQDQDDELDSYLIGDSKTQQSRSNQDYAQPTNPAKDYDELHFDVQHQSQAPDQEQQKADSPNHSRHYSSISLKQSAVPLASMSLDPSRNQHTQNAETVSQLSRDSPTEHTEQLRPASAQSNGLSPADTLSSQLTEFPSRTTSTLPKGQKPPTPTKNMAPPGTPQQTRKNDLKQPPSVPQQGQLDPRDMPAGSRSSYVGNPSGPQPLNYRGGSSSGHQHGASSEGRGDQGRSTPPLAPSERDLEAAYKELTSKYKKVKGLYFDKVAQVEQLQNLVANQRLSQSRTSLDDNEYATRFQRLEGAVTNLAFNIRKDWKAIPSWIAQCVNQDASRIGRQEMTAVGRACISRFLIDEIFSRCFHPGLDVDLSCNLKAVEQNIRRFSPVTNSQEESDALTSKVIQWRLATLDGLRDALNSPEAEQCREQFTMRSTTNLTAHLINCLSEPTPAGVEDSAHMIVDLAVSIAANLPLESRDIAIIYPMPGDALQTFIMKTETGLPLLDNPGLLADNLSEHDASSTGSGDREDMQKESAEKSDKGRKEKPKGPGMLSAMLGQGAGAAGKKGNLPSPGLEPEGKAPKSNDAGSQIVRFAGFVGVEVRGRQVLFKSPVWTVT